VAHVTNAIEARDGDPSAVHNGEPDLAERILFAMCRAAHRYVSRR
jgi:hypothetical protein